MQSTLYYRSYLEEDVKLYPDQLGGDLETCMLENLRETIEKHVISKGYIVRINSLLSYGAAIVDRTDLNANCIVPVVVDCYLCAPRHDMEVIVRISNTSVKKLIIAVNGPIEAVIRGSDMNTDKFSMQDNVIINKETNKPLDIDDYVKVILRNPQYAFGFKNFLTPAKLMAMATPEEIEKYNHENRLVFGDVDDEMI